jgi:hypothetical protein
MIVVKPIGGLCNKLRVTFSYYLLAKSQNKKLYVIWNIGSDCLGFFLDYFEPIQDIIFEKNNIKNLKIDYSGCEILKEYPPNYKELIVLPSLKLKIQNIINSLDNNYIAVHIRRTDHITLAKKNNSYTTDEDFFNFIDKEKENKNLYIATDNKDTYDLFSNKYKDIVKIPYHNTNKNTNKNISASNTLRQTTLEDSIIDIYVCVNSSNFKGSGWSSFSNLIYTLRKN